MAYTTAREDIRKETFFRSPTDSRECDGAIAGV